MVLPIREKSVNGDPPAVGGSRGCVTCGASFLHVEGHDNLRGIWSTTWEWFCSEECYHMSED